jgi:hypothetical protein
MFAHKCTVIAQKCAISALLAVVKSQIVLTLSYSNFCSNVASLVKALALHHATTCLTLLLTLLLL